MPAEIWLTNIHWDQMLAEVRAQTPLEACGLVAGIDHQSQMVFPIENIFQSPVRFEMDPKEQLRVFKILDDKNWDLLAIYHSHPQGPPFPSPTDLAEAAYPDAANIIWCPTQGKWGCRGFIIEKQTYYEIPIYIIGNP